MKPRNRLSRVMALLLSFAMIISMAPYNWLAIYAEDGDESPTETAHVVDETVDDLEAAAEDTATGAEESVKEAPQAQEQPQQEAALQQDEKSDADADAAAPADEEAAEDAAADADGATAPEDEAAPSDDEEEKSATAVVQTVKVGGAEITAEYSSDVFKEDVRLKAREITAETKEFSTVEKAAVKLLDEPKTEAIFAYDITFETSDGTELEPGDAVKISIRLNKAPADKALNDLNLVHISDNGKAEKLDDARINDDATKVVFESDAFSVYVVTAKDAASYEVDGTGYDSLATAINAVSGSGTIWVTETATEANAVIIPAGKDIVLKTADGAALTIKNKVTNSGTLEINDGITISPASGVAVENGGTLNVKGGTITSSSYAIQNCIYGDELYSGTINVSGGMITSTNAFAIYNVGRIETISGGTISAGGNAACAISSGTIGTISGGTIEFNRTASMSTQYSATRAAIKVNTIDSITGGTIRSTGASGNGIYVTSGGSIGTISGGTIIGTGSATSTIARDNAAICLYYDATITSITGGSFEGPTGICVLQTGATINEISGGSFGTDDSAYGINVAASNTITTITGNAAFTGKQRAINNSGTVGFESGITAPAGTVLLRNPSNAANLLNGVDMPAGYRISKDATSGGFYYIVRDNTVIYNGNGATTSDGKSSVSKAGDSASVTVAGNDEIAFEVPAGYNSFAGWNTAADGSGTDYDAGDTATVPSGGELVLYAQWAATESYNITVKHNFDYLVDPSVTSQFTWRTDPVVSENFQYEGANNISPKNLWDKSTDYIDYIVNGIQHAGTGIFVQGGGSLAIGALMDVDLDHPGAGWPFTYKLTSVTVDGTEVTDLTSVINFTEAAEVVFNYELVPIDLLIDYDADITGEYKGTAYNVNAGGAQNMQLTGSDNASYLVYPTQNINIGVYMMDMPWTVQGSRIVVGTTEVMPSNPYAGYGYTSDLNPASWTKNADGTYAVPGVSYNVEYLSSRFHGVNYSALTLPDELFNVSYKPVTITVTPKVVTVKVIDQSYIANGNPQGENNVAYTNIRNENAGMVTDKLSVEGLADGDYIRSFKLNGAETAVGVYNNKIIVSDVVIGRVVSGSEYGRTGNYTITLVSGKLTIESNETSYTVKHLQQNVNDDNYTEVTADRQTIDAAIGDEVTPDVKTYDGFTSPATQTVTVARDNATVVEYKYDRKQITASFDANGHGINPADRSGKYGAALGTLPAAPSDEAVFDGWYTQRSGGDKISATTTFPAESVTYYAHWKEYVYENVQTGEKYTELQKAFDEASDGDTIRPVKDYTDTTNATVPAGKNITLDTSEGHTLTINGALTVNGGLTIGDGLTVQNSGVTMMVNNGGTFTMNGGNLIASGNGLQVTGGAMATINDFGTIEGGQAAINCHGTITKIDGKGTVRSTDSTNSRALWVQSGGHVGEIAGGAFEAPMSYSNAAVLVFGSGTNGGVIDKISGGTFTGCYGLEISGGGAHVEEIAGGSFKGENALYSHGGNGVASTISGGTFDGGSTGFAMLNQAYGNTPWNITNATFIGRNGIGNMGMSISVFNSTIKVTGTGIQNSGGEGIGTIDNVTIIAGNTGIYNGDTIDIIKNTIITATNGDGISNSSTIGKIADTTVTAASDGANAIYNTGTISKVTSGTFTGDYCGLNNDSRYGNYGKIGEIAGGTFKGNDFGMRNAGTIDQVSGGEITGPVGINNESGGTIKSIDVADEGDLVVTGTDGAAVMNDGGTINKIAGSGIYIGTDNAIKSTGGTVTLEPGITAARGFGRYQTTSNTAGSQLDGGITIPDEYHMSLYTTSSEEDGTFHYLVKDNTVMYDGNGHEPKNGVTTIDGRVYDNGEDVQVEVRDNEFFEPGDYVFVAWNTAEDGTGTEYKAGANVEVPEGEEVILYAVWKYPVTITAESATKTYNSKPLTEGGFTTNLPADDEHVFTVTMTAESTITNAGSKDNAIDTVDGVKVSTDAPTVVGDYYVTVRNGKLTVNPKSVTITAKDANKPFDGGPLTQSEFDATKLEELDVHIFTVIMDAVSTITYVGEIANVIAKVDGEQVETGIEKQIGNYLVTTKNGKLEITEVSVTFKSEDESKGTVNPASEKVGKKDAAPKATATAKTGYSFVNWTDDNDDDKVVSTDAVFSPANMPGAYTAHFVPNTYTVRFNANEGSGEMADQSFTYDVEQKLIANEFEKEGYTFTGWNTKADGSGDVYSDEQPVKNLTAENGATVTLYAQWTANEDTKYTVQFFYQKNGEYPEVADSDEERTGTTDTTAEVTADDKKPSKDGYVFDEDAENILSGNIEGDESLELRVYFKQQFTVEYKPGDHGTFEPVKTEKLDYNADTPAAPEVAGEEGYTFTGWSPEVADKVTEDVTYVAQWKVNQYTITFDSNGGSPVDPITQDYGTDVTAPEDPTRDGYTFGGWEPELPDKMPAENTTVKAKWTPIEYKITYDLDGGSLEKDVTNPATYTIESDDITLNNPKKEGYTFNGWTGTGLDGATKEVTIRKGSTGDRSYTAKWKVNQYKVTYKYLGEVPAGASELPADALHDFGSKVKVADPAAAPGYTFSGWSKEDFTMPAEDVEITGTFTAKGDTPYKVEHYKEMTEDGKYQLAETESLTGKTGATATANPKTYEGFSLNTKAGGAVESGVIAADGSLVLKLFYDRNRYEITYDLNGGEYEGSTDDIVETYSYLTDITVHEAPTREGYEFLYWKGSEYQPGDSYTVTEDHLFTAQWEEVAEEPEEEEEEPEDTAKPDKARDKGVRTGDETDLMAIGGIFGASLLGLLVMIRRRKRGQQ